jgi:hypothetical protein
MGLLLPFKRGGGNGRDSPAFLLELEAPPGTKKFPEETLLLP